MKQNAKHVYEVIVSDYRNLSIAISTLIIIASVFLLYQSDVSRLLGEWMRYYFYGR